MACILCLTKRGVSPVQRHIELFSEEGRELNVCGIISKHFWLKPERNLYAEACICWRCWEPLRDFHQLYERVAEAHNRLESKATSVPREPEEKDPLPHEVVPKSEEVSGVERLQDALRLDDDFFDSEVKVEVHDLDLLPQIEIIEGAANISERAQRANRRGRPRTKDSFAAKPQPTTKRIKREFSPVDDSEPELPLAVLMNAGFKTALHDDMARGGDVNSSTNPNQNPAETATPVQKRRRGRPKKVKEEDAAPEQSDTKPAQLTDGITTVKTEQEGNVSDADNGNDFVASGGSSGTDDSSSSSSGSSDSDDSLPDYEPERRYAQIPKRVVVKPKKYRKRPKPLVPPKRMTREEIEEKRAQQDEYDKVIAKFFERFECPKCSLLVKNFGEMRCHFRASHNEDPGYMTCCGRKFQQRKALAEHVYVHWDPEHFKCGTCGRIFQDSRNLEIHENAHIAPPEPKEKKMFQCDKCPKAFTTKAAFEYHSFSKHVPKSEFKFSCPDCKKKLPTQRKLKDHIRYTHDPESAIICDKCGKKMRTQSNLKKHHEIEHSDVPRPVPVPMQCEICGTWLRHLAGLKQHMKSIHEESGGEHRCHICNKTSTNARALRRHIYHNHECERKFKCTMCEKAFKRPQDLREHTSTHTGEVLYTCPNCPMTFFSNANMYKHRQRLHRAEWEADRKKPRPPNIMKQAVGATAAMKMQQAVGSSSAFFAHKLGAALSNSLQPNAQPHSRLTIN